MSTDLRVCFVGDSFVAGVGDPERRGWVGRLLPPVSPSIELTTYNLGVRRETSTQIRDRWAGESLARLPSESVGAVVFSFGVNDSTHIGGVPRVEPENSAANLVAVLRRAERAGWRTMVVGPPPIADEQQNDRIAALDRDFAGVCRGAGVHYVGAFTDLVRDTVWMREVAAGDGAHPGAGGYRRFARLVQPEWQAWLAVVVDGPCRVTGRPIR